MLLVRSSISVCGPRLIRGAPLKNIANSVRLYSSKSVDSSKKSDEAPGFKKIFLIGIIGSLVFAQVARSLDKNKPKTTYSEQEFDDVMSGLRRRIALFPEGQLDVQFSIPNEKKIPSKIIDHYDICIDPLNVVEQYRNKPDNPYEALLNELYDKYGKEKYFEKLPPGMLVMLIGRYMKEVCRPNDRVIITDFPNTIQDAIKFENEVSVISKILVPNASTESDICKYYQTVNKVKEL